MHSYYGNFHSHSIMSSLLYPPVSPLLTHPPTHTLHQLALSHLLHVMSYTCFLHSNFSHRKTSLFQFFSNSSSLKNIPLWLFPYPSHCCCPTSSFPSTSTTLMQAPLCSSVVFPTCPTHLTLCHKFWIYQTACLHLANSKLSPWELVLFQSKIRQSWVSQTS